MNVNSGIQEAQNLGHPLLIEAMKRKGPAGFSPARQFAYIKNLDKIKKQLYAQHKKENVHVELGHFQRFKDHVEFIKSGAMIFLRDSRRAKVHKKIEVNGKMVEASDPDWSTECKNCGALPTIPETTLCGLCQFGTKEQSGGNW